MSLSSLIVQREIASIREVEEALARQVLYGGDLVTNLLEVSTLDEAALMPLVAEAFGLAAAPLGELPRPEPEVLRLLAPEVAGERNVAPLAVDRYGLTLAVAEPLPKDVEQDLAFALAMPISQKVASLVRIRQAIARDYALPLERRLVRLLDSLSGDRPRLTTSLPPMRMSADPRVLAPRPPSLAPLPRIGPASRPPPAAAPGTFVRSGEGASLRPARRRRGALTAAHVKEELEQATERDAVFEVLFDFARQYFDYTASFVVHGDLAEGRDGFGDGASREKVARIGVPLDLPSILSVAREKKATVQRVPAADGLDAVLAADLGRGARNVWAAIPVIVRKRVVALILGDGGEAGIDPSVLAEVEAIVVAASATFERLIVRRKLQGSLPPGAIASGPPASDEAPPTVVSEQARRPSSREIAARPAAEELAPPIRDLMVEPLSPVERGAETERQPSALAIVHGVTLGVVDPLRSEPPLPANVLAVRRPSGRPIPREEPGTAPIVDEVTVGGVGAPGAGAVPSGATPAHPVHTTPGGGTPRSRPRREAPPLDFGPSPGGPAVFASTTSFGVDEDERELLAEIQGGPTSGRPAPAPDTMREVHEVREAHEVREVREAQLTSPRATSPPPMLAAAAITDVSPVAIDAPARPADPPPAAVVEIAPSRILGVSGDAPPSVGPPSSQPLASEPGLVVNPDDSDVLLTDSADSERHRVVLDVPPASPPRRGSVPPEPSPPPVAEIPGPRASVSAPPASSERPRSMPPSEQQVSVAPHKPPSSHGDLSRSLPSVIVDVTTEYVSLVARVVERADEEAEAELVRAGGHAMPAIMERFPGPVTVEPERVEQGRLPRVAECGPVLRVVAGQRRTALPFVLVHVQSDDADKRFWATYLLTELVYPDALDAIMARLFDEEPKVRRAARAAARAFAETNGEAIVERVVAAVAGAAEPARKRLALEALGETRDRSAVPALLREFDGADVEAKATIRAALVVVTRQDFGTSKEKWEAWWSENAERHRVEWLIDALMHEHAAVRAAAGEELKTQTKEFFGYYEDLPKRERERAQARYREWWAKAGRVRFSRAGSSRS